MGKKPDLSEIEKILTKGKDFELTDARYEKLTGRPLPKAKSYLVSKSALADLAKSKGFDIYVVEKKVILKKKR